MYDWPEERGAVDAFWTHVRVESGLILPETLERPADEAALLSLWRDPSLIFTQCCWGPISLGLVPGLRVLAQPDYSDVPGGRGAFYRSALVARRGTACPVPAGPGAAIPDAIAGYRRLAINARHSMSGWLALRADADGLWERPAPDAVGGGRHSPGGAARVRSGLHVVGDEEASGEVTVVETGGHRASVQAVAAARADLAAIDCRAWALALRHEPCARELVVVGWTAERPGLPYVTGRTTHADTVARLRETLIGVGCHPPQERDG